MKIIITKIKYCYACPEFHNYSETCSKMALKDKDGMPYFKRIRNPDTIPDWCPLPDAEGKE